MAVYKQLLKSGVAPEDIVVSGDSAGGGLATALLLKARDDKLPAAGRALSLEARGSTWRPRGPSL